MGNVGHRGAVGGEKELNDPAHRPPHSGAASTSAGLHALPSHSRPTDRKPAAERNCRVIGAAGDAIGAGGRVEPQDGSTSEARSIMCPAHSLSSIVLATRARSCLRHPSQAFGGHAVCGAPDRSSAICKLPTTRQQPHSTERHASEGTSHAATAACQAHRAAERQGIAAGCRTETWRKGRRAPAGNCGRPARRRGDDRRRRPSLRLAACQ